MNLPTFSCQSYEELAGPDEVFSKVIKSEDSTDYFLQLKQDGIWAQIKIYENTAYVYSKTGQLKKTFSVPVELADSRQPIILIGEFMFGSQWSTHPERSGRIFIFDCLVSSGRDLSFLPYKDRYREAVSLVLQLGQPFSILPCYSIGKLGEFWLSLREETEGFIIRRWSSSWYVSLLKLKFEVEDDFIVSGVIEGKNRLVGTMGSLELSQYENGQLKYVQDCGGGFDDEARRMWWIYHNQKTANGTVVLVKGKGRFHDGAIRHPCFVRVRTDKNPTECLLKKQSK